jgi:hypothetical protein
MATIPLGKERLVPTDQEVVSAPLAGIKDTAHKTAEIYTRRKLAIRSNIQC